jgi:hypothetical protein
MKDFSRKHLLLIIFLFAGAIGGFLYWKFVGCLSGTCVIKSVWYLSTLYGIAVGYVAGSLIEELAIKFKKEKKYE